MHSWWNLILISQWIQFLKLWGYNDLTFGLTSRHCLSVELESNRWWGNRHLIANDLIFFLVWWLSHPRNKFLIIDVIHHFLVAFNEFGEIAELSDWAWAHELADWLHQCQGTALLLKLVPVYPWQCSLHQTGSCSHWTLSNAQIALSARTVIDWVIVMVVILKIVGSHTHIQWLQLIVDWVLIVIDAATCSCLILFTENIVLRPKSGLGFHPDTLSLWESWLWSVGVSSMNSWQSFLKLRQYFASLILLTVQLSVQRFVLSVRPRYLVHQWLFEWIELFLEFSDPFQHGPFDILYPLLEYLISAVLNPCLIILVMLLFLLYRYLFLDVFR